MQNAVLFPDENPPNPRQLDNLYVVVGKLLMSLSGWGEGIEPTQSPNTTKEKDQDVLLVLYLAADRTYSSAGTNGRKCKPLCQILAQPLPLGNQRSLQHSSPWTISEIPSASPSAITTMRYIVQTSSLG